MYFPKFTKASGFHILLVVHLLPWVATFTVVHNNQRPQIERASCLNHLELGSRRFPSAVLLFESKDGKYVEAEDLPAIQALFNKYCDKDGLMTKKALEKMLPFNEMLVSPLTGKESIDKGRGR